ncbi:glycosyltransferase [Pendulispora albinea]|uniref:Glycosyltransferase n=1 Tax=Pendulispora albinea TaxID=2741071 RepID=A0ABZ2M180_9BACT
MRILHVVQSLDMGGQERLILHLARALMARGHQVGVASLTLGGVLRREFEGITVIDVPRQHGFDAMMIARMAKALADFEPDAIHTHNPSPMFYAVPAARLLRIKSIVHTKHGANIYGKRSLHAARVVARFTTAFVAVSEGTADAARVKERVPPSLLHVIPNGIPLASFGPNPETRARVRRELGIPEDAYVVGSVGRLAPEKDYPLLVRAMSEVLGPNVRLVLVGSGPSQRDIERAIEALPEPKRAWCILTGSRNDVPDLLTAFDVFSLTSQTEGLPLVIPEAMATALPIVATAVGGLPSIVSNQVGILAPYGDAPGLTAAMAALRDDPERRKRMGEAACAYAHQRFSIEEMTDRYESLYRGVRSRATKEQTLASIA